MFRFKYKAAVYFPARDSSENCVMNVTSDVTFELHHNNINYLVSRHRPERIGVAKAAWKKLNEKTSDIQQIFRYPML